MLLCHNMEHSNSFCKQFGIKFPLFLAGMGGVAGPDLVSCVANNGCAGVLGCYKYYGHELSKLIKKTLSNTNCSFGMNFVPEVTDSKKLRDQIHIAINETPPNIFISFYDLPNFDIAELIHKANRKIIIQVGSFDKIQQVKTLGANAAIIQSSSAGGHLLGTLKMSEVINIPQNINFPIITSGGFFNGKQIYESIVHGAVASQLGTIFIPTIESDAHIEYKQSVIRAMPENTIISDSFSVGWKNRIHRIINNLEYAKNAKGIIGKKVIEGSNYLLPKFSCAVPTSNTEGDIGAMALYCGTSCEGISEIVPAGQIIDRLKKEFNLYANNKSF